MKIKLNTLHTAWSLVRLKPIESAVICILQKGLKQMNPDLAP